MSDHDKKEIDELSGVETTGHEWDGLKELNNPLPRWWVWVWIVCILWSFWYFIIYPAWPTLSGATQGSQGYTQFKELAQNQKEIQERQNIYLSRFEQATDQEVLEDPELYAFAMAGGKAAFKDNCATCHGSGATGGKGYPNLIDDDWIWGGKLTDIHQTITHGIRVQGDYDSRMSDMPAYGADGLLTTSEIESVVAYVMSLSGSDHHEVMSDDTHHGEDTAEKADDKLTIGHNIFRDNCAACHGPQGKGDREFGAPNLTDKIWLYGGDHESLFHTVFYARRGMMPAWKERLDSNTIRQLALYLHQLGGGEADEMETTAEMPVEEE